MMRKILSLLPNDLQRPELARDSNMGSGMLVLTRRPQQCIVVDRDVIIRVLRVNGDYVSLGFDAPRDRQIFREEVYQRIQEEKRIAATVSETEDQPHFPV